MKKYNSFLYLGLFSVAVSTGFQDTHAANTATGARTTRESRGAGLSTVDTPAALSSTQDLGEVSLDSLIAAAPGQPSVSGPLLASCKQNMEQLHALLEKLESDISYRDSMLAVILEDLELIALILNDQTLVAKYPKTAATLQAATASGASAH